MEVKSEGNPNDEELARTISHLAITSTLQSVLQTQQMIMLMILKEVTQCKSLEEFATRLRGAVMENIVHAVFGADKESNPKLEPVSDEETQKGLTEKIAKAIQSLRSKTGRLRR